MVEFEIVNSESKKRLSLKLTAQKTAETADLVTFTEEILNGKLQFLFSY